MSTPPRKGVPRQAVIDASVVAKWFLRDESHAWQARQVRTTWEEGQIDLVAPLHLRVEVPRALQVAVRDHRLEAAVGEALLNAFLEIELPTVSNDELIRRAFRLSSEYGVALYDGLYCVLAERLEWPLLLADARLFNRLADRLPYLFPLWEWPAESEP